MLRLAFPILILVSLFALVPYISRSAASDEVGFEPSFSAPSQCLDVDGLRARSKNRPLRLASEADLRYLRKATMSELVDTLLNGTERERRLVGSLLGISGHTDGILALIRSFEREEDPRCLAALAMALAETKRTEAVEALIDAIRDRQGLAAYEACRALRKIYGVSLGLDVEAWDRWLSATKATRD